MKNVRSLTFLAAVAFIAAACSDRSSTAPNNAGAIEAWRNSQAKVTGPIVPGTCTTLSALYSLSDQVFGAGGPNSNSVKSKIDQVDKANKKGDRTKANDAAFNAVRFIFQKFKGPQPLQGTPAQVAKLISDIFCFAGINITISDPANSNLIDPSASTQVVKSSDSTAGTSLPPGSVQEPIVLEFTKVPNSFSTPGAGPLNTKLDQYPGFYLIKAGSASGSGPQGTVTVAICPDASVPASVRGRLRLGHEKTSGFEITPPADASFLTCPAPTSLGLVDRVIDGVMSKLLPKTLYAKLTTQEEAFRGGVGGSATEFSPFDPVDPEITFRGGVGGSATEFKLDPTAPSIPLPFPMGPVKPRTPMTGTQTPNVKSNGNTGVAQTQASMMSPCLAVEAPWSAPLAQNCRPGVILATHLGTVLANVPVSWQRVLGGGTIAPETPGTGACGTFGTLAANTTDATGRAGVCWTMGPNVDTATVTATPSVGGDVPPGVTFLPVNYQFGARSIKVTPTVSVACPASVVYNNADQTPCTAAANDDVHATSLGARPVSYTPGTPHNVGPYTGSASYPATTHYNASSGSANFLVTPATPTVALTCPASVEFTGSNVNPCNSTATGVGGEGILSPAPVVSYTPTTPNGVGYYTANSAFAATLNYVGASATPVNFKVMGTPVVSISCTPNVTYTGSAQTPCTASVMHGASSVGTATLTYAGTHTDAGTYAVNASFAGDDLYHPATAPAASFTIDKAPSTTTVTCPANQTFNGSPIAPCSATVTGAGGFSQAVTPVNYTDNTNAGTANASATFAGGTNHLGSSGSATFTIDKAATTTALTCPASQAYTGSAIEPCSADVTGPAGLSAAVTPVTYANNTNPGTASASATYAGAANYLGSTGNGSFVIDKAPTTTLVSCPPSTTFNGSPQTPCTATVTGPGGLNQPVPISYLNNTNAGSASASASYGGSTNYLGSTGGDVFTINKAASGTTVTCPASVAYTGSPLTPCSANVTGAGGLSQAVPIIYLNNVNAGTASASATFAGDANHNGSADNANFTITAPPPPPPPTNWSATGPGTVTMLENGSTGMPSMSYNLTGSAGFSTQTWKFSTVTSAGGTIKQSFSYTMFHAWFNAVAFVRPFIIRGGSTIYPGGYIASGSVSGGSTFTGSFTFTLLAGDTYGFEIGGSHFDSTSILSGTFLTTSTLLYSNTVYAGPGRNCWHDVKISVVDASTLRWTNGCAPAVSWLMHATGNPLFYTSGPDYPYYGSAADVGFTLTMSGGVIQTITGPSGEIYAKVP